jgi:fructan beta-fructosidase
VVDIDNTSGLQTGTDPPIVAFYTWSKDFSQRMCFSNDGGDSWEEYKNNPVVEHIYGSNRDPKVFWHEPSAQWIMILYVKKFEIFVSQNLIEWTNTCSMELEGFHECPDFFELPVDGDPQDTRWVVVDAAGRYYIGAFDGSTFTPEGSWRYSDWNPRARLERSGKTRGEFYATQTWSNMPSEDGRRIQIAAMRDGNYRLTQLKFHNQMTFPCELTLRHTAEGISLFRWPVQEIEKLYKAEQSWTERTLEAGEPLILGNGDLLDISATLELPPSQHETTREWLPLAPLSFRFNIRGIDIHYDVKQEEINCQTAVAPLRSGENSTVELRILVDRISLEIFGNGGEVSISTYVNMDANNHTSYLESTGGPLLIKELKVRTLNPAKIQ